MSYSPIYHSYVLYEVGCTSCKVLAYASLMPVLLLSHLVFSFVTLKDFSILLILLGHIVNEGINSILKRILEIPRPYHPGYDEKFNQGFGMPSSHAGFMAFYSIIWGGRKSIPISLIVMYSRYHLLYHEIDQLILGAIVGSTVAILWKRFIAMVEKQRIPMLYSKDRIFSIGNIWHESNVSKHK